MEWTVRAELVGALTDEQAETLLGEPGVFGVGPGRGLVRVLASIEAADYAAALAKAKRTMERQPVLQKLIAD
jgi:hypothetical protein